MFEHQDHFAALNGNLPLADKLRFVHGLLKQRFDFIERIAVAIYEPQSGLLKTFVHSSGGDSPLTLYSARLSDSETMQEIIKTGRPRLVNDLEVFSKVQAVHTRRIAEHQYKSSYTMPMYLNGEFFGFMFFNSYQKNVFDEESLHYVDMIGHMLSLLVMNELSAMRSLVATVKSAASMTLHRDPETGAHLNRMANYTRLIAREIAKKYQLNDEFVEHIFLFAPLHDLGKIGIPDNILLKPGRLSEAEMAKMKTHTVRGGEIIDMMLKNIGMSGLPHAEILRNIALYHHEAVNGSGYGGLKDQEIPIEAKIVAVADVFDALTSVRPYKEAWSNDKAFEFLHAMAGSMFNLDCVSALTNCRTEVEIIQSKFKEDLLG
jgi:HD-GYP domain-containing protein (c-di-GMP phosphodiesterase class II)